MYTERYMYIIYIWTCNLVRSDDTITAWYEKESKARGKRRKKAVRSESREG